MPAKVIELGTPFDRLTVAGAGEPYIQPNGKRKHTSVCDCACGSSVTVRNCHLRSGATRSCGCLNKEEIALRSTTHGQYSDGVATGEISAWNQMRTRTTNPNYNRWARYGGRGIKVCDRWMDSFEAFYADMGPRPSPKHSLDRFPDNDGNYCPENCRWATATEQSNNRNSSRFFVFYGIAKTISEWSRISQVGMKVVWCRLSSGWPPRFAIWAPTGSKLKDLLVKYPHHVPAQGV